MKVPPGAGGGSGTAGSTLGVLGLGELGGALAAELAGRSHRLRCLDLRPSVTHVEKRAAALGIEFHNALTSFAPGLDAVFVTTVADAVVEVASAVSSALAAGTLYVDCATKTPSRRDEVFEHCRANDLVFADVAVVDPVGVPGRPVNLLVSGPGAERAALVLEGTRFVPEVLDTRLARTAEVRLCRTIFTKGFAAVLLESLAAAEALGATDLLTEQIARILARDFAVTREVNVGTMVRHGVRRAAETRAAADQAAALLGGAPMSAATAEVFRAIATRLASDGRPDRAVPGTAAEVIRLVLDDGFFTSFPG